MHDIKTTSDYINLTPSQKREFIGSVFKAAIKDQQALLDRYEKAVAEGKF